MNIHDLEDKADEAAELLGLMSSPHRLRILCLLIEGEMSVGGLAETAKLRQTAVSQHLALLRAHKIVSTRREGTTVFYSIEHGGAEAVIQTLHKVYCQPVKTSRKK
jgi:DNA-binding transcriptional ArsR family regulator